MRYSHEGYIVEPASYKLRSGRWSPAARISLYQGDTVTYAPVYSKQKLIFKTQKDADSYALRLAKAWIDGRISLSGSRS